MARRRRNAPPNGASLSLLLALFALSLLFEWWQNRPKPLPVDGRCERVVTVTVCYDRRTAFMHHKFVIPDELGVWTGSTNLTWNAFARNNENSLWRTSPKPTGLSSRPCGAG